MYHQIFASDTVVGTFSQFWVCVFKHRSSLGSTGKEYKIYMGRDPFNQNSNRFDREKWSTSKGGPVFSKLFRLDWTDPLSFGPKFPEILVEWIARIKTFVMFRKEPTTCQESKPQTSTP